MRRRISGYFISILAIIFSCLVPAQGQDTITVPLKIHVGIEAIGPAIYFAEKKTISAESYISADMSEKLSVVLGGGYLNYKYSKYNYTYLTKGAFLRAGVDLNILKPKKSMGIYWGGIGLRYGISRFSSGIPLIRQANYWGESSISVPETISWGHFLEVSPGMRAEIFRNFSLGWSVNLRMLLYSGKNSGLPPLYFPGFGNSQKRFSSGFSYFIVWNIPYKKIRVIIKKPEPEEPEDTDIKENPENSGRPGLRQRSPGNNY